MFSIRNLPCLLSDHFSGYLYLVLFFIHWASLLRLFLLYQMSSPCSKISYFLISSSALSKTSNFLAWPFSSFIITIDQLNMRVQTCSNEFLAITSYKSYSWGKSRIMSMLNKSSHRIDPCSTPEKSYCQTLLSSLFRHILWSGPKPRPLQKANPMPNFTVLVKKSFLITLRCF